MNKIVKDFDVFRGLRMFENIPEKYKLENRFNYKSYYKHINKYVSKNDYNDMLESSSQNGDLNLVKLSVKKGANIHAFDDIALRWASRNGHLETVKYLVSQGANIHAQDDIALRWARKYGHLEVVNYLLNQVAIHSD